jgi:hypothetical protein
MDGFDVPFAGVKFCSIPDCFEHLPSHFLEQIHHGSILFFQGLGQFCIVESFGFKLSLQPLDVTFKIIEVFSGTRIAGIQI